MTRRRPCHPYVAILLTGAIAMVASACAPTTTPSGRPAVTRPASGATTTAPEPTPEATAAADSPSAAPAALIAQPVPPEGLPVAPDSARVDLAVPVFSDPTAVTNPLFPVSRQASVLMLGRVDDKPFRTEVTLLPYTRLIAWEGQQVEALVSQYMAYSDGRVTEVAYDFYAGSDDGSVWYLGEDVFDFADGAIVTTQGTWQAGRDGPAAMIMPAEPRVGMVYRPENIPGFVFEEVTVKEVGKTLDGPLGPISGGMVSSELHADGGLEEKVFAPGYGEFLTGGDGDLEALAMAVPTDALAEPVPAELLTISDGALRVFEAAGSADWEQAATDATVIGDAWSAVSKDAVPSPIESLLTRAMERLGAETQARKASGARGAAIEVARLAFDVQLRYRPATEIDLARFDLWAAQLLVDAAADDADGVRSAQFALDYIRERFVHTLDTPVAVRLNLLMDDLQVAAVDDDLEAAAEAATGLRGLVADLAPSG